MIAPRQTLTRATNAGPIDLLMRLDGIGLPAVRSAPAEAAEDDAEEPAPVNGKLPVLPEEFGPIAFDDAGPSLLEIVMLPGGMLLGNPGVIPDTAAAPRVGNGALGSTVQDPEETGQEGGEVETVLTYAAESTPVGVSVAHCLCRLLKSGCIGVGVP